MKGAMKRLWILPITFLAIAASQVGVAAAGNSCSSEKADPNTASISFFSSQNANANWTKTEPPPGDTDPWSVELTVGPANPTGFAGACLRGFEGLPAPPNAPSYDFKSSTIGPSLGSPRLVVEFSDGGNIQLRPLFWLDGVWIKEGLDIGPTMLDWDNSGGSCGFLYEQHYQVVKACHTGFNITQVFVVSDSGAAYPNGYTNWIDNIQFYGTCFTVPGSTNNSKNGC